jgi:hypothetical protein
MSNPSPDELLKAALEISEAAAAIPMRYFRSDIAVEDKPDESPVTIADRQTEEHIRRAILERFPSHGIFGEEFGRSETESAYTWIVDPIDGTKSFISGMPLFGMLLFALLGQRVPNGLAWPALAVLMLLGGYCIGTMFAVQQLDSFLYIRTSTYLSISLLFFAALIWNSPERTVPAMASGLVIASVIAAALGIAGYFGVIHGEFAIMAAPGSVQGSQRLWSIAVSLIWCIGHGRVMKSFAHCRCCCCFCWRCS